MPQSILDATESELERGQAKITYIGEQDKPILTVVLVPRGRRYSMEAFTAFQAAPRAYDNDTLDRIERVDLSPAEFREALRAVRPVVTRPDRGSGPDFLSFCVARESDAGMIGEEFRIAPDEAAAFYDALIQSLDPRNGDGRDRLARQRRDVLGAP